MNQASYDIHCEWGLAGVARLAPESDAVVIVDVLSFSTCVSVAAERGALIYPYRFKDASAAEYARSLGAELAGGRGAGSTYSLSPLSLRNVPNGAKLVLPSPNGATLSLATEAAPTLAGCLRNASAVARAAQQHGQHVAVVPAGERWPDGSLRPSIEDWIGAGAIIHGMEGVRSPEAWLAEQAFLAARGRLADMLIECGSGRELIERGFRADVVFAAEFDVSTSAPQLHHGAYR